MKEIEARGMTFQALADGPEDGPLLHGLPRNRWKWHHPIPAMAEMGFCTVAPDLRGFCPGARPQGVEAYHIKEHAQDTLEKARLTAEVWAQYYAEYGQGTQQESRR